MKRLDPGNRRPHLQPIYAPYQTAEYLAWLAESRPLASEQLSGQLLSPPTRLLGPQDEENCAKGPSPRATWPFWSVNTEQGTDGEGLLNLERLCPSFTLGRHRLLLVQGAKCRQRLACRPSDKYGRCKRRFFVPSSRAGISQLPGTWTEVSSSSDEWDDEAPKNEILLPYRCAYMHFL